MERYESAASLKKKYRAKHNTPGKFQLNYILLPYGYSYNAEWKKAKKGDTLIFLDGGEYLIYSVRVLKMSSPLTDILCRMRYGISLKGAMVRWKTNVRLEGNSSKVISDEECLMVVYNAEDNYEEG